MDELLKYLYTLSDCINVSHLEGETYAGMVEVLLEEIHKGLPVLSKEVKHLANILVVADKYCVRDLVTLVARKISIRLSLLQECAYIFDDEDDGHLQAAKLLSEFSEALSFEKEIPPLQEYHNAFLAVIAEKIDICTVIADVDVELARMHPKLIRELLQQSTEVIRSERQRVVDVIAELPARKRKRFESEQRSDSVSMGRLASWLLLEDEISFGCGIVSDPKGTGGESQRSHRECVN
jgi:hypothetical protein